jgi:hypothetical protein
MDLNRLFQNVPVAVTFEAKLFRLKITALQAID